MFDERRAWIAPLPLGLGVLSIAVSWVLVVLYAAHPSLGLALAWIHAVALGGFTSIALAILVHVIPAFTDLPWRGKALAKAAALVVPVAALGFVAAFATNNAFGIATFGTIAAIAVVAFALAALATLARRPPDALEAAIARAMAFVVFLLLGTAVMGAFLASAYARGDGQLLRIAPSHAALGIIGWLTLLTMGVSARTFRPLLRSTSRVPALHIVSNTGMSLSALLVPIGLLAASPLFYAGCVVGVLAAAAYALDSGDRVMRAQTPHRPVHAMIGAAMAWLVASGIFLLWGNGELAIVAALTGWLASMVYAHLHHIAVRVLATIVISPDDETPPWELLATPLSWTTFALAQAAAAALVVGVHRGTMPALAFAGACGLAALLAYGCNMTIAVRKARTIPIVL